MTVFLTSHIGGSVKIDGKYFPSSLRTENQFIENLKARWPQNARLLFIASNPVGFEKNDTFQSLFTCAFPQHGMSVAHCAVCDDRYRETVNDLNQFDVLILAGGHVPTQNTFFKELGLKEKIRDFNGIVIGISAGTMNAADPVYVHPELEGEATDPAYRRFLPGLGLTTRMVIPHYHLIKNDTVDGLRVFEDIAYPDSIGKEFYALADGSYILAENGVETLYGEAFLIRDGVFTQICAHNQCLVL